jgi:hypothetical protein
LAQVMGGNYETAGRMWIRRIAFDAIRKHPTVYVKFVWTMMYNYFRPAPDYDFRYYLQNRAWLFYIDKRFSPERGNAFMVRLGKEFASGPPPAQVLITASTTEAPVDLQDRVLISPTRGWRIYELTHLMRFRFFEYWFWSAMILVGFVSGGVVLVWSRFTHEGAFVVFIVATSAIGASLVVSLVEYSQPRYSYPMEWSYGVVAVLLPLLVVSSPHRLGRRPRR